MAEQLTDMALGMALALVAVLIVALIGAELEIKAWKADREIWRTLAFRRQDEYLSSANEAYAYLEAALMLAEELGQ